VPARRTPRGFTCCPCSLLRCRGESGYIQELLDLVAIPSVSSLPENRGDVLRAAAWLEARLKSAGLEVGFGSWGLLWWCDVGCGLG
jgi:hypothetical protein